MADDPNIVSILASAFSEPLHAKRMAELLEALGKAEAAKGEAEAKRQEAEAKMAEAHDALGEAKKIKAEAEALTAGFEEKNKGLEAAITQHNSDRAEFLDARAGIEQGHRDRQGEIDAKTETLARVGAALKLREDAVTEREATVAAKEAELVEREARLDGIVAQLSGKEKAA